MQDLFDREADNVKYYIEDQLGSRFFVELRGLDCSIAITVDDETLCPEIHIDTHDKLNIDIVTDDLIDEGNQIGYRFVITASIDGEPFEGFLDSTSVTDYVNSLYRWARIIKFVSAVSDIEIKLN